MGERKFHAAADGDGVALLRQTCSPRSGKLSASVGFLVRAIDRPSEPSSASSGRPRGHGRSGGAVALSAPARPENSLVGASTAVSIVHADSIRTGAALVVQLGELLMILNLHCQGPPVTAIGRRTGRDPRRSANTPSNRKTQSDIVGRLGDQVAR